MMGEMRFEAVVPVSIMAPWPHSRPSGPRVDNRITGETLPSRSSRIGRVIPSRGVMEGRTGTQDTGAAPVPRHQPLRSHHAAPGDHRCLAASILSS